ncbi:MAG: hypothetical protein AB4063_24645 [Crocosphaera sp.]
MSVEYQFTNRFNWTSVYDQTITAEPVISVLTRYFPIPKIVLPFTLDTNVIAVYCANSEAPINWRYGARYFGKISTNLSVGLKNPETVIKSGKIYLNQIEIIKFPPYASSFTFEVEVAHWHREFHLKIWEYDGTNQNTLQDKLNQLLATLQT